jgi:tetratricopeptide (TPR) repeat protein
MNTPRKSKTPNAGRRLTGFQLRRNSKFQVRVFISGIILAALMVWARGATVLGADLAAEFDSANKLYEQGKFREAASAYEKIVRSGPVSSALYFNLGNAFYKCGAVGRAIAAYRQAERLAPRDPDLRANLQFVRNQIQGPSVVPNRWQRWLGRLTVNEWTVLASIVFWLWLLSLVLGQLRPAFRPPLRSFRVCSGAGAAALCLCLSAALLTRSAPTAIVIARDVAVRNGPLDESQTAFTVHDGAELTVLDHKEGWLQVSAGDQPRGWLKREQVLVWPSGTPGHSRNGGV